MALNTPSSTYLKHKKQAGLVYDVVSGDTDVKDKKTLYVPALSEQDPKEYDAYLNRPSLTNYARRVRNGLLGLVFMSEPNIEQKGLDDIFKDIDTKNNDIVDFAEDCLNEVLTKGRVGILVDMAGSSIGMTVADMQKSNIRPHFVKYDNTSILNFKYEKINNKITLSRVILSETKVKAINEFEDEEEQVYRVLSLIDGVYTSRLFTEDQQLIEEVVPTMNGKTMGYIPFYAVNSETTSLYPSTPILFDVANKNLTLFKLDVDLYHGLHFTALPTPYISGGDTNDNSDIRIGSTAFKVFDNPQAKMEFLEFKGQGLSAIPTEKAEVRQSIIDIASNILTSDKNTSESAETIRLRSIAGNASLSSVTKSVSRTIEKALSVLAEWAGQPQEIVFELNNDFNTTDMDATKVKEIVSAWLSGGISNEEKFKALKKEKLIGADVTYEQHIQQLEESKIEVK